MKMYDLREQAFVKGDVLYRLGELRQIEEARETGYSWVPFMYDKSIMKGCKPIFQTEGERDSMMEIGWTRVLPPSKPNSDLSTFDSVKALIEKLREAGVTIDSDGDHETIVVNTRAEEAEKQLVELRTLLGRSQEEPVRLVQSVYEIPTAQLMEAGPTVRLAVSEMNSRVEFQQAP